MAKSRGSRPVARDGGTVRLRDPRSLRSQEALRGALLRLIETKQFDRITLRDITEEAGVSYPTVFNHYADKEDLFGDLAAQAIADLLARGFRERFRDADWRPGEGICAYVIQRRGLWRTLLTAGATEAMRTEFIRQGREFPRTEPAVGHDFPEDLVSGVIASGIFEIIAWWLAQGDDYPAATVATMLETLVIEPGLGMPAGYFTNRASPSARHGSPPTE